MAVIYARQFSEIEVAITNNAALRTEIHGLIEDEPMPGKVLEGGARVAVFRNVLKSLVAGEISIADAFTRTEDLLPRSTSAHSDSNRVFPSGWAERLVRTQFSRFYNQAVLQLLVDDKVECCFVPHSSEENGDSACSIQLAGKSHSTEELLRRLIDAYSKGNWSNVPKIPNHPHCTHTITPLGPSGEGEGE